MSASGKAPPPRTECPLCKGTGLVNAYKGKGKRYIKVPNSPCICPAGKERKKAT